VKIEKGSFFKCIAACGRCYLAGKIAQVPAELASEARPKTRVRGTKPARSFVAGNILVAIILARECAMREWSVGRVSGNVR
jgi:hypothetical protein